MPAGAQGLEKIALCTAGDIITFIGCGTADLFPVHLTAMQRERTIAPHTHLLCTSGGGWFRDIRFFFSFTHHCFFKGRDWRYWVLKPRLHCVDCKEAPQLSLSMTGNRWFEATLRTWTSSKILLICCKKKPNQTKKKNVCIRISFCFIESIKMLYCGGGREKEMKRRKNRWRHSTSLLK